MYRLAEAVRDRRPYYGLVDVERMRLALRSDHRPVEAAALGAGSATFSSNRRRISAIARSQQRPAKVYRLLYHLSRLQQADTMWELGTGLGLSSIVLASAHPGGTLHTVEGDPAIAAVARDSFHRVPYTNIRLHEGLFRDMLPKLSASAPRPGLLLLDGDHSFEATVSLLEQILPTLADDGLLILDDIYWSPGMKRAWQWLQQRPEVTVTVDTFYLGLAWKRNGQAKEAFTLRL